MNYFFSFLLLFPIFCLGENTDNFFDGDFSKNPHWQGDSSNFKVNTLFQLQLNSSASGTSCLSFETNLTSLDNIEWQFYIKQAFSPSSSNYSRVYLASDQSNLKGSLNGYYLQFGEAGSNDAIELFKQLGSSKVSVFRGTNGKMANSFASRVKVKRNSKGVWSVYSDTLGGYNFNLEGSATDTTFNSGKYFGISCVYTSSNATKFYFDDFSVSSIDTIPPKIINSKVISNKELEVDFNEPIISTTATNVQNYFASNSIGSPVNAVLDEIDYKKVHLTFLNPFLDSLQNKLTVSNMEDLNNNISLTDSCFFTYHAPIIANYKDVVINELFADPTPRIGLPSAEYIELYNNSSKALDLKGWQISDGATLNTLSSFTLSPNSYLILCDIIDTALFNSYENIMCINGFISLNNSGDRIVLKNKNENIVDSVSYNDKWYNNTTKIDGGWSLELINPAVNNQCSVNLNWSASNDLNGGTPGKQNSIYTLVGDTIKPHAVSVEVFDSLHLGVCFNKSLKGTISNITSYLINLENAIFSVDVNSDFTCATILFSKALVTQNNYTLTISNISDCSNNQLLKEEHGFVYYLAKPHDLVISEIMADPDPSIGLPNQEYVELYNNSNYPIKLKNWTIQVGLNSKTIHEINILPKTFLVLTSSTGEGGFDSTIIIDKISGFPSLLNSGSVITIRDNFGQVISSVSYTDEWYHDFRKQEGGWALEQIDANNPCGEIGNWKASIDPNGGTPGKINSVASDNIDDVSPKLLRVSVIDSLTIQLFFTETIDSASAMDHVSYFVNNDNDIIQVTAIGPDYKSFILKLNSPLIKKTEYTISLKNTIVDCIGNAINSFSSAKFAIPEKASFNDIVINEILFDPKENGVDFVEVYNKSDKVIDLNTISLAAYDSVNRTFLSSYKMSSTGFLIFPNEYLILTTNSNEVKNQYFTSNPEGFLQMQAIPGMNVSDGIIAITLDSSIIDIFHYSDQMHFPLLNSNKGVSLERVDFNRPTQDITNWHSASKNVGFATPAYQNSQYLKSIDTETVKVFPEIFSPDNDGNNDFINVSYRFDTPGFIANANVYDAKGRLIKPLIKNELIGTSGVFSWDGIDNNKQKAAIGIYVIHLEVFDLEGKVKHFKNTCVLASKL